jgi:xylan 1,4-beta-xylosidase
VPAPALPPHPFPPPSERDDFDDPTLSPHFNSLRVPVDASWASLTERPGFLRLYGRESLNSLHRQSLLARRQQALRCEVETVVDFEPESFQQMAGLVCYYNTKNHYYLYVTHDEARGRGLGIALADNGIYDEPLSEDIALGETRRVFMKAVIDYEKLRFYYALDGKAFRPIGPVLDASKLSDEHATREHTGYATDYGFTGSYVGVCVQDLTGKRRHADFDYFIYREIE